MRNQSNNVWHTTKRAIVEHYKNSVSPGLLVAPQKTDSSIYIQYKYSHGDIDRWVWYLNSIYVRTHSLISALELKGKKDIVIKRGVKRVSQIYV